MKLKAFLITMMAVLVVVPQNVFAEVEESQEWEVIRLEQVEAYTPENLEEWTRLFDLKEEMTPIREEMIENLNVLIETEWHPFIEALKETSQTELIEFREDMKLGVENGDITFEEAKEAFEAFNSNLEITVIKEDQEALKIVHEDKKAYAESLRAQRVTLNESIALAIENETTVQIAVMLNDILVINQMLEVHHYEINELIEDRIEYIEETLN